MYDVSISWTSRVLTVASLQRLEIEAFIPAPGDCQVQSMIKFLKAQSIVPIEIHRQPCEVYGQWPHTARQSTHLLQEFTWEVFNRLVAYSPELTPGDFHFFYTSRNSCPVKDSVFRMTERRRWVSEWFQSQAAEFYDTGYKSWSHGMTNISILVVSVLKNSSTLAASIPINWVLFL